LQEIEKNLSRVLRKELKIRYKRINSQWNPRKDLKSKTPKKETGGACDNYRITGETAKGDV
jgi:hypothetical protein